MSRPELKTRLALPVPQFPVKLCGPSWETIVRHMLIAAVLSGRRTVFAVVGAHSRSPGTLFKGQKMRSFLRTAGAACSIVAILSHPELMKFTFCLQKQPAFWRTAAM